MIWYRITYIFRWIQEWWYWNFVSYRREEYFYTPIRTVRILLKYGFVLESTLHCESWFARYLNDRIVFDRHTIECTKPLEVEAFIHKQIKSQNMTITGYMALLEVQEIMES